MQQDAQTEQSGALEKRQRWGKPQLIIVALFVVLYPAFLIQYGVNYLRISNIDFPSFWCAAEATFEHQASPYDREYLQSLLPVQRVYPLVPEAKGFPHQIYIYPQETELPSQYVFPFLQAPPTLLAFFPLSLMTYDGARMVILLLNHLLILFLLWFVPIKIIGLCPRRDTLSVVLGLAYVLTFYPMVVLLNHGQINLFLTVALCLFWYWTRQDRPVLASLSLVFAILLKTYPILLLLFLLICKRFRVLSYSMILFGAALCFSVLWLPEALWEDWLGVILPTGGYASTPAGLFSPAAVWNQSFNGFVSRLFLESRWSPDPFMNSPAIAKVICYIGSAGFVGASAYAVFKRFGDNPARAFDWAMLLFFPLMYLVAPIAWEHHLVYVLISALVLLAAAVKNVDDAPRTSLLIFLCAVVIALQGVLSIKFYGVLGVWGISLYLALSDSRDFPTESRPRASDEPDAVIDALPAPTVESGAG